MSVVDNRQKVCLPDDVMAVLDVIATCAGLTPAQRLVGTIHLIDGWAYYDRSEKIDPTLVAIPDVQWHHICAGLAASYDQVNLALQFMNYGPGAYDPSK